MHLQHFIEALSQAGIVAVDPSEAPPFDRYTFVAMKNAPADPLAWLRERGANDTHLRIDCSFLRLPPGLVQSNAKHFWSVLEALKPSPRLNEYVRTGVAKLRGLTSGSPTFNFLHVRLETDWLGHCNRWGTIPVRTRSGMPLLT